MTYRRTSVVAIWAAVAIVLIYDLTALLVGGADSTISRALINASYNWPIIPFAVGVLIGHLFFGMGKDDMLRLDVYKAALVKIVAETDLRSAEEVARQALQDAEK